MSCPCCKSLLPTAKFWPCTSATRAIAWCCPISKPAATGPVTPRQKSRRSIPARWRSSRSAAAPIPIPTCGVKNDKAEFAQQYAREIATEVDRLFHTMLARLNGNIECQLTGDHAPAPRAAIARRMGRAHQNQRSRKLLRQGATRTTRCGQEAGDRSHVSRANLEVRQHAGDGVSAG